MNNNLMTTIIGFGAQGKAWALNLRDSGRKVNIALRANSPSFAVAEGMGFEAIQLGPKLSSAQLFVMLIPDHTHLKLLQTFGAFIPRQSIIVYAHGFSVHKENLGQKFPHCSHLLLAPKAIASEVRFQYETGGKLGAVYSTQGLDSAADKKMMQALLLSLAQDLGITGGPYEGTFAEETMADLFSEQGLLCSILPYCAEMTFRKLIAKGVREEIAFMECWTEVKLIADAMIKMGPLKFFELISPNALIGGEKARQILLDETYEKKLDGLLEDILSGKFYTEIDNSDFSKIKNETLNFWQNGQLVKVYEKISKDLL